MQAYKAHFVTPKGSYHAQVHYDEDHDYFIEVNGVKIFLDVFDALSIFAGHYSAEQLVDFPYLEQAIPAADGSTWRFLNLLNCSIEVEIPIQVSHVQHKQSEPASLFIKLISDDLGKIKTQIRLLAAHAEVAGDSGYFDYALDRIAKELKDLYHIHLCGCCKNCETNPFGGSEFINQMCFKKQKEDLWTLKIRDKRTLWRLMKERLYDRVDIIDSCAEFVPRH